MAPIDILLVNLIKELQSPVIVTPAKRGLARTALVLGIVTASVPVLGYILATLTPGPNALGVTLMALMIVIVVGFASVVVGILAVVSSQPETVAIIGQVITVAAFIALLVYLNPWVA